MRTVWLWLGSCNGHLDRDHPRRRGGGGVGQLGEETAGAAGSRAAALHATGSHASANRAATLRATARHASTNRAAALDATGSSLTAEAAAGGGGGHCDLLELHAVPEEI